MSSPKRLIPIALVVAGAICVAWPPRPVRYTLSFSTFLGGSDWEHARDITVDREGNVIVVGGTGSLDFPTTPGAFQRKRGSGGSDLGRFGPSDAFVAKFAPDGRLLWSTYLGGPNYDRAYGVITDKHGFIYVTGRAGPGFPVTAGAFQRQFRGGDAGAYGKQNCFAAKLPPDGSRLVWASYVGVGPMCRDIAIDSQGFLYLPSGWDTSPYDPPREWFANAFQKARRGGREMGVVKLANDGRSVAWATWLGGSGNESVEVSIRVDGKGNVHLAGQTESDDMPLTPGAHSKRRSGGVDFYVAALTADGRNLIYGTYLGSPGDDYLSTHNLAVDNAGNAYVALPTHPGFPATPGAFATAFGGGETDWGVAKLSPSGALLRATFLGGSRGENPDGISVDRAGNVYISGQTDSADFPTTADAYQRTTHGGGDAVFAIVSADFSSLLYATYIGGSGTDNGRASFLDGSGNFYLTGATDSPDWPVRGAFQRAFAGGRGTYGSGDAVVAKFSRQ